MPEVKEIEINVKTGQATNNVDKLTESIEGTNKEAKKTNQTMSDLEGAADKFTGGFITGLKKASAALKGMGTGIVNGIKGLRTMKITSKTTFNAIKVGIASTGIGLLVLALGSLITYFTQSQKGADKLKVAFAAIGTTISVLVDRLSTFGGGLLKILSGDFSEGVDMLKDSFKGLGEEIREEAAAATDLEKANQKLQDREIAMIKTRAEARRDIEAAKLASADQTKTIQERGEALERAIELEKKVANEEIAIAKERARIITEQNALGESMREDLEAQAEAEARVIQLEAERDVKLKELVGVLSGYKNATQGMTEDELAAAEAAKKFNDELAVKNAKLAEEQAALEVKLAEQYDAILQASQNAQIQELNAVEDKYNTLLDSAAQFGFDEIELNRLKAEEINKINKKYDDEDSARKKQKAADDQAVQLANLQVVAGALNGLSQLAGENAAAGKALSAAEAVINTYTGATKALSSAPPPFNFIAAGGVIASGLASVRKIYSTKIPTTKPSSVSVGGRQLGGGGGGSSPSSPTPNIPTPQGLNSSIGFDTTGANLGNQIAESLQGSSMRAYVVNQDIQSAQKLDRKIEETATFG
jgi:hypothetical protein